MKALLLTILLLTAGLAGCLDGGDGARIDAAGAEPPTLPQGLTMEGAEVVSYTNSEVTWQVSGTFSSAYLAGVAISGADRIGFDVPGGVPFAFYAELEADRSASSVDTGSIEILDGEDGSRCYQSGQANTVRDGSMFMRCRGAVHPLEGDARWTVRLTGDGYTQTPFTLTFILSALATEPRDHAGTFSLPQDLEMEGAEVVSYTETEAIWEWHSEVSIDPTAHDIAMTRFSVPESVPMHLEVSVMVPDPAALSIEVWDAADRTWCHDPVAVGAGNTPAYWDKGISCQGHTGPHDARQWWDVLVYPDAALGSTEAPAETAFTVRVRMTTDLQPFPTLGPVPGVGPGCDSRRPAYHHTADGQPAESEGTAVACLYRTGVETYRSTVGLASDATLHHFPKLVELDATTGLAAEPTALVSSSDGGLSWTEHPVPLDGVELRKQAWYAYMVVDPITDRIFADVYNFEDDASILSYSDDEGETWVLQGYLAPPEGPERLCDMTFGDAVVGPDGKLMMPVAWCATPRLAISEDEGRTWAYQKVSGVPILVRHETLRGPSIDVDRDGTVYYGWITEDGRARVAYSTDDGTSWSEPLALDVPGIETMRKVHLAAGAPGKLAIAYYGTDGGSQAVGVGSELRIPAWHGYMTVTSDLFAQDPVFTTARVNDPATPLIVGECDGKRCQEAGDVKVVRIGPDGAPYANFVDGCGAAWTTCEPDDGDRGEGVVAKLWGVDLWDDVDPNGPYPDEALDGIDLPMPNVGSPGGGPR